MNKRISSMTALLSVASLTALVSYQLFAGRIQQAEESSILPIASHATYIEADKSSFSLAASPEFVQASSVAQPKGTSRSEDPSFVQAAKIATAAVVHIKAKSEAKTVQTPESTSPFDQLFKEFFEKFDVPREYKSQPKQASGSGVIISPDGHIVTNYHVIEGADKVEVTLDDNRRYTAQVIGQDPDTDIALLKIKETGLASLTFGNSDQLQVGEWVLAVGNPFELNSTVTKGIVSAKARTINMTQGRSKMRIEAFIQTDAAVNPGNSGGALVNLHGELVGINTAILAPTGSFTGYSFAIPSSIVQKVIIDLKKYGVVQRAMLGVVIRDVDADLAEKKGLQQLRGVYIAEVNPESAAALAGLQAGDVIVAVSDKEVKNTSQLQEYIARYKPNDKVKVTFYRKNKKKVVTVTLKNVARKPQIIAQQGSRAEVAGAMLENIDKTTQKALNLTGGVRVKTLKKGKWQRAGIRQGFIITAIDKEQIGNLDHLIRILNRAKDVILVAGIYPGQEGMFYYAVAWDDKP